MASYFIRNEYGLWCPCCGELLTVQDEDFECCSTCGYPDDAEAMAQFHAEKWEDEE